MNTIRAIKTFFAFPQGQDENNQHVANLIHIISLIVLFAVSFLLLQRLIFLNPLQLPPNFLVIILMSIAIKLNQKGKIRLAGNLLMWTLQVFLFYLLIYNDGIHDTAMLAYTAAIVFAGIILRKKEFIAFTILALLSIISLSIMEITGVVKNNYSSSTNIIDIIDILLILILTALSIWILTNYLIRMYLHQKSNEVTLTENAKQLKILKERFDQVADNAGEWVWEVNAEGLYTYSSAMVSKILGYQAEELVNKMHFYDFFEPSDKERLKKEAFSYFASRKAFKEYKNRNIAKTGEIVVLQTNGSPVISESGDLIGYRGADIDITEKEINYIKLTQFGEIFNRINYALYIFRLDDLNDDSSLTVVFANPASKNIWEQPSDDLVGKKISDVFSFGREKHLSFTVANVIKEGRYYIDDNFSLVTGTGSKRYFTFRAYPLADNCVSVSFDDITMRKNNEIQLAESQAKLFAIVESTNNPIWSVDCNNFGLISFNSAFFNYFKEYYNVEISIGMTPHKLYPQENAELWISLYTRALSEGPFRYEYRTLSSAHILFLSISLMKTDAKIFGISVFAEDITERKKAENALLESEELFRKLVTTVPDTIIQTDINNNITFINKSEIKGVPFFNKEKILGKNIMAFVSEESMIEARENVPQLFSKKLGLREYKLILEGVELECEINGDILHNSEGEISGMVYVIRNISQRKRDEAALRQSLLNFRRIFNLSPYAMAINELAAPSKIIDINEAYLKLTEFSYSETIGKPAYVISDEIITKLKKGPFDRFGYVENVEVKFNSKFGKEKYALLSTRIIEYDYKPCALTVIEDITDKKKVELELNDSYIRYRALFEHGNDAVFILDKLIIVACNIKAVELFGVSKDEIIGKSPLDLSAEFQSDGSRSTEKFYKEAKNFYFTENEKRFEWKLKRKSGDLFDGDISLTKINLSGKEYVQAFVRDISDRKQIENDLDVYRKHLEELIQERTYKLEELNRLLQNEIIKQRESEVKVKIALEREKEFSELKSQFISTASHEFRTPLAVIQSSTELLQRFGRNWNETEYDEQIEAIKSNIADLTELMTNVLTISRTETGVIKFEPQNINLYQLSKVIIENIKYLVTDNKEIVFNYVPEKKFFYLDELLLKFIIQNLLANAVKYSFPGTKIEFSITLNNDNLFIKVSDQGIGIPQEDFANLFEPFHRGSNVSNIKGTGLGMSIIKRAVEIHKAEISFYSEINIGTTFLVKFPAEILHPDKNPD